MFYLINLLKMNGNKTVKTDCAGFKNHRVPVQTIGHTIGVHDFKW